MSLLRLLSICFLIFFTTLIHAQPYNSNLLIERGVDPQVLNLSVTTFRQQVAFTLASNYHVTEGEVIKELDYKVLYDPFTSYGIDLRVQVENEQVYKLDNQDVRGYLDAKMGLQSYLQKERLYDLDSLSIESSEGKDIVISFKFDPKSLPRELNYYQYLQGFVYINEEGLDKIVVRNTERYKSRGVDISQYEKVLNFTKIPFNGGYLLVDTKVTIKGKKSGLDYRSVSQGEVTAYSDKLNNDIALRGGAQKKIQSEESDYKTYYVELDRTFPLLGQAARKEGYDLPKPFGISLVTMMQETTMHMTSFELNGKDVGSIIGGDKAKVQNSAAAMLVRADMWVLPFLNIGVLLGQSQTSSDINMQWFPDSGLPESIKNINITNAESSTVLYGGGATIAGGIGDFFGTVDMQYITSYTEAADAELTMSIITPIVGYSFARYGLRALLGAQYQDTKETIEATIAGKDAVVGLRSEKWAGLIGVDKSFDRHWSGSLMYSYGEDRNNLSAVLGYRF